MPPVLSKETGRLALVGGSLGAALLIAYYARRTALAKARKIG